MWGFLGLLLICTLSVASMYNRFKGADIYLLNKQVEDFLLSEAVEDTDFKNEVYLQFKGLDIKNQEDLKNYLMEDFPHNFIDHTITTDAGDRVKKGIFMQDD
jgi:hypothetical protein